LTVSTLSDLATGAVVEVHGQRNAAGEVLATRISAHRAACCASSAPSPARGGKFLIGALTVQAGQAAIVPTGQTLANGQRVAYGATRLWWGEN
jgi:hypothetical protein